MTTQPSILICGGPRLWREALAAHLAQQPQWQRVSVADSYEDLVPAASADLCIVYGDFEENEASECMERFAPHQRVLIVGRLMLLGAACMAAMVEQRLAWTSVEASLAELSLVLRQLATGTWHGSPQLLAAVAQQLQSRRSRKPSDEECRSELLTPREETIAALVAEGLLNKQIARRLGIRVTTVKSHVHRLMRKLQVRRRGNVVRRGTPCSATLLCMGKNSVEH